MLVLRARALFLLSHCPPNFSSNCMSAAPPANHPSAFRTHPCPERTDVAEGMPAARILATTGATKVVPWRLPPLECHQTDQLANTYPSCNPPLTCGNPPDARLPQPACRPRGGSGLPGCTPPAWLSPLAWVLTAYLGFAACREDAAR